MQPSAAGEVTPYSCLSFLFPETRMYPITAPDGKIWLFEKHAPVRNLNRIEDHSLAMKKLLLFLWSSLHGPEHSDGEQKSSTTSLPGFGLLGSLLLTHQMNGSHDIQHCQLRVASRHIHGPTEPRPVLPISVRVLLLQAPELSLDELSNLVLQSLFSPRLLQQREELT